jgi:hypothetical protein
VPSVACARFAPGLASVALTGVLLDASRVALLQADRPLMRGLPVLLGHHRQPGIW